MFFITHRQPLFHLLNILLNFSTNIYGLPITSPAINQAKDSIFDQMLNGENLIMHEDRGVVFSRVGYYHEVDGIFGLTVTVPVSQYICPILPTNQVKKLRLCVDYQESLRIKIDQENIQNQSPISDFLTSTNNTRFSAEKVSIKTHHHHRSKRFIPFIVGAVGALAVVILEGSTVYNTVKGAQLSIRVS